MENTYKSKPISNDLVLSTRSDVEDVANELRDHIRSTGPQAHVDATLDNPGFMTPEQLSDLLGIQDLINDLKNTLSSTGVPDNVILYWWRDDLPVPNGYVLCDGNNGTVDIRDKYIRSINTDSDYRDVEGSNTLDLNNLPVPRHRHSFKNYFCSEEYNYLLSYKNNSNNPYYKVKYVGGQIGLRDSNRAVNYPLYFKDYTSTYSQSNTSSSYTISNEPPHYVLKGIMRQRKEYPVVEYGIGSLIICLSNSIPDGFVELSGNTIDLDLYESVKDYVLSNGLSTTESDYNSTLATYGSVLKFIIDEDLRTIRLPKISSLIGISGALSPYTIKKSINVHHIHGLGKYGNNQGAWGRYSYKGAKYPSGTTGWFWNGRGDAGTVSTPETTGDTIVSYEKTVSSISNGELTSNVSLVIAMCISHPSSDTATVTDSLTTDVQGITDYLEEYEDNPVSEYNTIVDVNGRTKVYGNISYSIGSNTTLAIPSSLATVLFVKAWDSLSYTPISVKVINSNSIIFNTVNVVNNDSTISYEIWGI